MNFQQIIKQLFPAPPTLEEFINANNPTDIFQVEYLEKQYEKLIDGFNK